MPAKPKKGKKKSKKQRKKEEAERLAREEAERQAEEERKRQETEAKLKAENDKIRDENRKKLREEEIQRFKQEFENEEVTEAEIKETLIRFHRNETAAEKWKEYLNCKHLPDPESSREINSFIRSLEDKEEKELEVNCGYAQDTIELTNELLELYWKSITVNDRKKAHQYYSYLPSLYDLIVEKLDFATAAILLNSHKYSSTKQEFTINHQTADIKFGLWLNTSTKGFRTKLVKYGDLGMSIDVPKQLGVQQIAIRALHISYDDCDVFRYKQQDEITPEEVNENQIPEMLLEMGKEAHKDWVKLCQLDDGSVRDYIKQINGKDYNMSKLLFSELPSELKVISLERAKPYYDWYNYYESANELMSIGGVLWVEVLQLPEQLKSIKGWDIQRYDEYHDKLNRLPYPPTVTSSYNQGIQTVKMRFTVPSYVFLREQPRLGWWDKENNKWSEEGFSDIEYDSNTRMITLNTTHLTALSLLFRRQADFPYENWRIYSDSKNKAVLELQTKRLEMSFTIDYDSVILTKPNEPEIQHIINKKMKPYDLLMELRKCGINIIPCDGDAEYSLIICDEDISKVIPKETQHEIQTYREMSQIVSAFECSNSHWNANLPAEDCFFQIVEYSLSGDASLKKAVMMIKDKESPVGYRSFVADMNDFSNTLDREVMVDDHQQIIGDTHLYMRNSVQNYATEDGKMLLHDSDPVFQETIQHLLTLIRPLSFSS